MNLFTPTRKVPRLDYYGNPYEVSIVGREELNLGQLWDRFKQREFLPGSGYIPQDYVANQSEQQMIENEY